MDQNFKKMQHLLHKFPKATAKSTSRSKPGILFSLCKISYNILIVAAINLSGRNPFWTLFMIFAKIFFKRNATETEAILCVK